MSGGGILTGLGRRLLPPLVTDGVRRWRARGALDPAVQFDRSGRIPWTHGYHAAKQGLIAATLEDGALLARFASGAALPEGYGIGIDERAVEYPWLVATLPQGPARLLDAGSALNHYYILTQSNIRDKTMTLVTLAPEAECFWRAGVSYVFEDLRSLSFRDSHFDLVTCISTLEHVGLDNSAFTGQAADREQRPEDYRLALAELRRVLRRGGSLFLTVPFGRARAFSGFVQFDSARLDAALAAFGPHRLAERRFFRYTRLGWTWASEQDCASAEYVSWAAEPQAAWPRPVPVEPDRAAAARAVACLRLEKA